MDRRTLLKLMAASAAVGLHGPAAAVRGAPRVAVVGGGIVGACIAYHLVRAGADVTLLERGEVASRASRGTFAWVNATWAKQPRHYHRFNQQGLTGWKQLEAELAIPVRWGGSLEWFATSERQARLEEQIAEQVAWGEPARMVPAAELPELEPNVDFRGAERVAFSPNDGALDPVLATQRLLSHARAGGARLKTRCEVLGAERLRSGGLKLSTGCGDLVADRLILATGADPEAPQRLAGIEIPQRSTPGVIAITAPAPRLLNRIIVAPGIHVHQRDDGRFVLGEQDGPPDTEAHALRLESRPNAFPSRELSMMHAERMLQVARQFVPGIAGATVDNVFIGWRPLPLDGHPAIGASPAVPEAYVAIMHSGVSLAPLVGELVAHEVLGGRAVPALSPYRPDRSFEHVRRY